MTATLHGRLAVVGALLLLATGAARAQPKQQPELDSAGAKALGAKIDARFAKHWKDKKVQPAPLADDAELLRPAYVNHWVNVWRPLLLPELKLRTAEPSFETWLRTQLELKVGYDKLARDLLTTPLDGLLAAGDVVFVPPSAKPSALGFYAGKKAKPEVLAASTARLFLGVRIECAQCHDHPFAEWKQEQFWEHAAFFAGLEAPGDPRQSRPFRENPAVRKIAIADTEKLAVARFLDGSEPKWQDKISPRQALAAWVTSAKNPYFSRAAANRLWAYFLGAGLVEPVDEMVGKEVRDNDPGGLLDELAKGLVAHDFDLKFLMRHGPDAPGRRSRPPARARARDPNARGFREPRGGPEGPPG
jgi:hypothetical protein